MKKQKLINVNLKRNKATVKQVRKKQNIIGNPKSSTSGLQILTHSEDGPDSDPDQDITDEEKCCVCTSFRQPDLKKCQYFKIVSWGQCDMCNHWV